MWSVMDACCFLFALRGRDRLGLAAIVLMCNTSGQIMAGPFRSEVTPKVNPKLGLERILASTKTEGMAVDFQALLASVF